MWSDIVRFFVTGALFAAALVSGHVRAQVLVIDICTNTNPSWGGACVPPSVDTNGPFGNGKDVKGVSVSGAGASVDMPTNPNVPLRTPAGWSPPAPGSLQPIPPSTAGTTVSGCSWFNETISSGGPYANNQACGQLLVDHINAAAPTSCSTHGEPAGHFVYTLVDATQIQKQCTSDPSFVFANLGYTSTTGCPAGYTLSGGSCNLTNASVVEKPLDGKCGVTRVSNQFVVDPNDPDCAGMSIGCALGVCQGSAGGVSSRVEINGDGTTTITSTFPAGGGNTSTITGTLSAPDGSGNTHAIGQSQGVTAGQGSQNDPTKAVSSCGSPGEPPCKIDETGTPSAGAVTQAGTFGSGNAALDTAKSSTLSGVTNFNPATDSIAPAPGVLPSLSGSDTCVEPVPLSIHGVAVPTNVCTVYAPFKAVLGWSLWLGLAVFAWIRLTRGAVQGVS